MSIALILCIAFALTAGIVGLEYWFSTRTWVAFWRGHRVVIRFSEGKLHFELDGQLLFTKTRRALPLGKHIYTEPWTHPALGETEITVSRRVVGGHGEFTLDLQIGDELIPLTELEHTFGRVKQDQEEIFAKLTHGAIEPLGDPRWVAACTILNSVRQSTAVNDQIREAANVLQVEMRRCFESRLRLSEDDLELLGANQERVAEIQARLEEKIVRALEAVKSLHMATISLEAQADERAEMSRVEEILDFLNAEDEVASFMASLREQNAPIDSTSHHAEFESEDVEARAEVHVTTS